VCALALLSLAGCSGMRQLPQRARRSIPTASCVAVPNLAAAPLPGELGVYRAGPLILAAGDDLAQHPEEWAGRRTSGSEAIAVLTGSQPAVLSVDPASRRTFSLQFTPHGRGHPSPVLSDGHAAVRFPACSRHLHRFDGGVLFKGRGCARLHVEQPSRPAIPLLIPIGNTLRGCPVMGTRQTLGAAATPFLGVACPAPGSIACDRVGIGVHLRRAATLVTVQVAGRLVTLSPPTDPPDDLWLGYLFDAGLRHGLLKVHISARAAPVVRQPGGLPAGARDRVLPHGPRCHAQCERPASPGVWMRPGAARSRARYMPAVVCALALTAAATGCGSGGRPSGPSGKSVAAPATTTTPPAARAAKPAASAPAARARGCDVRSVAGGRTHLASGAIALATGYGSLWVSGFDAVSRLEPAGGQVVARIRTPGTGDYSGVAVGDRSVWVTSTSRGVVYRINPSTDRVIATVRLGGPVTGVAVGAGRVWVTLALPGAGQVIAIDPHDDRVTRPPIEVGPGPGQVVYRLHAIWVQNTSPSSVIRVNPASGRVTTLIATTPVAPGSPVAGTIAVGYGSLWSAFNGSLTQVDPVSGRVRSSVPIPRGVAVALGDGRVWVLAYTRSSSTTLFDPIKNTAALWEVDPASGRVTGRPIRLGATQPIAIAAGRHALWIADYASSTVTRIRLVLAGCGSGDPTSSSQRRDAPLPHRFLDSARGVAIRYPAGWRVDQRPLTRLASPRQLLVVSSFPIRQRRPDPNCTPKTAISELPSAGALLFLLEHPSAGNRPSDSFFAKRPARFHLENLAAQPLECFGMSREIDFQTAGRELYLLAYFGPKASRPTEQLADRTLDSLMLHARGSPQRRG